MCCVKKYPPRTRGRQVVESQGILAWRQALRQCVAHQACRRQLLAVLDRLSRPECLPASLMLGYRTTDVPPRVSPRKYCSSRPPPTCRRHGFALSSWQALRRGCRFDNNVQETAGQAARPRSGVLGCSPAWLDWPREKEKSLSNAEGLRVSQAKRSGGQEPNRGMAQVERLQLRVESPLLYLTLCELRRVITVGV